MPQEKIIAQICIFDMALFKMHVHINEHGRDSFESTCGNAISGQTALR